MKRIWALASLLLLPTAVFAESCQEIMERYQRDYFDPLFRDTQISLANNTDPEMQQGIRDSYQMQLTAYTAQRDAVLASNGCGVPEAPPVDLPEDPDPVPPVDDDDTTTTPPADDDTTTPPADDDDDTTLPPADDDDPAEEPTTPAPQACLDQLDAYADLLRSQGVRQNDFVAKMKKKMAELGCVKNYGQWRSHCAKKKKVCHQKKQMDCKKKQSSCKKPAKNNCKR